MCLVFTFQPLLMSFSTCDRDRLLLLFSIASVVVVVNVVIIVVVDVAVDDVVVGVLFSLMLCRLFKPLMPKSSYRY